MKIGYEKNRFQLVRFFTRNNDNHNNVLIVMFSSKMAAL